MGMCCQANDCKHDEVALDAFNKGVIGCKHNIYALVGDSITFGYCSEDHSYPDKFKELLADNSLVYNFGLCGRTMRKKGDAPYWVEDKYKEVLTCKPTVIVLMLGTNDAKIHNHNPTEYEADYIDMLKSF